MSEGESLIAFAYWGHSPKFAEDYATDAAERAHPGGRDAAA